MTVVFTQEDADILFTQPVAKSSTGWVYFDERNGHIKAVSYSETEQPWAACSVEIEQVKLFVDGLSTENYRVVYDGQDCKLVGLNPSTITVRLLSSTPAVAVFDPLAPVQITVVIPEGSDHGTVALNRPAEFEQPIVPIIITRAGNPDEVLGSAQMDLSGGDSELLFRSPICGDVDFLCPPLSMTSITVERYAIDSRPMPLPSGRFHDLQVFEHTTEPKPGLLARLRNDQIAFELFEGGGRMFDRTERAFPVAIYADGDFERMESRIRLSVNKLLEGPVVVPIRGLGEVDVVGPHVFVHAYLLDERMQEEFGDLAPYRGQTSGVLVTIDRRFGVVKFRALDENQSAKLSFVHPVFEDVVFFSGVFTSEQLATGAVEKLVLPREFKIISPNVSVYVEEIEGDAPTTPYVGKRARTDEPIRGLAFWIDRRANKMRAQIISGGGHHLDVPYMSARLFINEELIQEFPLVVEELKTGKLLGFSLNELPEGKMELEVDDVYSSTYFVE